MSSVAVKPNPLLQGAILSTMMRLAAPNAIALMMSVAVAMAETFYIGRLGMVPLAAMALVFPLSMLTQMMSNGAMGSGVISAISRALGGGQRERAGILAMHAMVIGLGMGLLYSAILLCFGRTFYTWLGGEGAVLEEATHFGAVLFSGAVLVWFSNTLGSIVRGTGNMRLPSSVTLCACLIQIALGGWFSLGLGWGMTGVALSNIAAMISATLIYAWCLLKRQQQIQIRWEWQAFSRVLFKDILRVGAVACVSPLQTVLVAMIITGMVSQFGPQALAGVGIAQRLEFVIMPLAFALGMAVVPMVGMAVGAGQIERARRVLWTGGGLGCLVIGSFGLIAAVWPTHWSSLFTQHPDVLAYSNQYLSTVGPCFGFVGMGLVFYFASLGAGHSVGPVLVGTVRLIFVAVVGLSLMSSHWASIDALFMVASAAMAVYGLGNFCLVKCTTWRQT